jgi:hypothetical protein
MLDLVISYYDSFHKFKIDSHLSIKAKSQTKIDGIKLSSQGFYRFYPKGFTYYNNEKAYYGNLSNAWGSEKIIPQDPKRQVIVGGKKYIIVEERHISTTGYYDLNANPMIIDKFRRSQRRKQNG